MRLLLAAIFLAFAASISWAQTPLVAPNRISPEQQAALDKYVELKKKEAQDKKECLEIAAKVPLKDPANVIAEQAAAFAGCWAGRGHTQ